MKNIRVLFGCFLLSLAFLNKSCKNMESRKIDSDNLPKVNLPQIDGFYLFKSGMSFYEVSKIFDKRAIKYRLLNLENRNEVNYPISWRYVINAADLEEVKKVKVIEGFRLPILDKYLDRFQIGFFNDTIFYFNYQRQREAERIKDSEHKVYNTFTKDVREDLDLLRVLSEGLHHKYGYPYEDIGELNAFYPSTPPFFQWNDDSHNGSQFLEREIWLGRDSVFHILLQSHCIRDSSKQPPYVIRTEGINFIEVLFNSKYADYIEQFGMQRNELESRLARNRLDSLATQKNRKFDSL